LIGFSRGGFITAIASSTLNNPEINYVVLATCTTGLSMNKEVVLTGHVFSIYETSDTVGSCKNVIKRSKEHGAFYRPIEEWLTPVVSWLNNRISEAPYSIPRTKTITLKEPATGRVYPIYIQLPQSYKTSQDKHYPVIYATDGPYSFPNITGATRLTMNSDVTEESIIVGVSYSIGSRGSASRVRDYTPIKAEDWKLETGQARQHTAFLEGTVNPQNRTFIGHSLGGLFGTYILLEHPELFDNYIIGSPSVWFQNDYILSLNSDAKILNKKRVYISVGELETPEHGERENMVAGANKLFKKLQESIPATGLKLTLVTDATHETVFPTIAIQGLFWIHSTWVKHV
jgi:predicted alpha/beta superfamily hydrolase